MNAVIVAHGDTDDADRALCVDADLLIAADGGALALERWGIAPHVVVGDLDSLGEGRAQALASRGAEIVPYAKEKDESDLELAVRYAIEHRADEVVLLGVFGGRLDHALANAMLLADPDYGGLTITALQGTTRVRALHGGGTLAVGAPLGTLVTLLPVGGDADGVRTTGLRYPLDGGPLLLGRSRGLSNVVVTSPASVSLASGVLLVIETEE